MNPLQLGQEKNSFVLGGPTMAHLEAVVEHMTYRTSQKSNSSEVNGFGSKLDVDMSEVADRCSRSLSAQIDKLEVQYHTLIFQKIGKI